MNFSRKILIIIYIYASTHKYLFKYEYSVRPTNYESEVIDVVVINFDTKHIHSIIETLKCSLKLFKLCSVGS